MAKAAVVTKPGGGGAGNDKAQLKASLKPAQTGPVSMACAQGADGKTVLVVNHRKPAAALEKQLKAEVPDAKHYCRGTVAVSEADPKLLQFTVNKPHGTLGRGLGITLKGTGYSKVEILLEDGTSIGKHEEADDQPGAGAPAPGAHPGAQADGTGKPPQPGRPNADGARSAAEPNAKDLTQALGGLIKKIMDCRLSLAPSQSQVLTDLATEVATNLRRDAVEEAAAGIEVLRQAIADVTPPADAGTPGQPGTNGQSGAPGQPGQPGPTAKAGTPGQPGANGQPGNAPQTGPTAKSGANGRPGTDGQQGKDAQPGPAAKPGANGPAAPNGQHGTTAGAPGSPAGTGSEAAPNGAGLDSAQVTAWVTDITKRAISAMKAAPTYEPQIKDQAAKAQACLKAKDLSGAVHHTSILEALVEAITSSSTAPPDGAPGGAGAPADPGRPGAPTGTNGGASAPGGAQGGPQAAPKDGAKGGPQASGSQASGSQASGSQSAAQDGSHPGAKDGAGGSGGVGGPQQPAAPSGGGTVEDGLKKAKEAAQKFVADFDAALADAKRIGAAANDVFGKHGAAAHLIRHIQEEINRVMHGIGHALPDLLHGIGSTPDPEHRAKLIQEAKAVLRQHLDHVTKDPLLAVVDSNPMVPVQIQKRLLNGLSVVHKALSAPALHMPHPAQMAGQGTANAARQ